MCIFQILHLRYGWISLLFLLQTNEKKRSILALANKIAQRHWFNLNIWIRIEFIYIWCTVHPTVRKPCILCVRYEQWQQQHIQRHSMGWLVGMCIVYIHRICESIKLDFLKRYYFFRHQIIICWCDSGMERNIPYPLSHTNTHSDYEMCAFLMMEQNIKI